MQLQRDEEKRIACKNVNILFSFSYLKAGITLIEVPYWWNFEKKSLEATIHQKRFFWVMSNVLTMTDLM